MLNQGYVDIPNLWQQKQIISTQRIHLTSLTSMEARKSQSAEVQPAETTGSNMGHLMIQVASVSS